MKVGLTYDLRQDYLDMGFSPEETAEFDKPATIDAIESSLKSLGFETERIGNVQHLAAMLSSGYRWDLVFNIAEGMYGLGREAQVPALLDAYSVPYTFSDPLVLSLTLHKGMTKRVVRDLGFPTAPFFLVEQPEDIKQVDLPFPLFVKPVAEGTSKGISPSSIVNSAEQLRSSCEALLTEHAQPVLVETFLAGREFTLGLLGSGTGAMVIGVLEVALRAEAKGNSYSYFNKQNYQEYIEYKLFTDEPMASTLSKLALSVWQGLGCLDAGRVDIRLDEAGNPFFLEVNPLAGLNPIDSDLPILWSKLGRKYEDLIAEIVNSALSRLALRS